MKIQKINLWINWFDSPVRPQEFDYCLKRNLKIFDRVFNLNGRPTFNDFFGNAGRFAEDINVVANLDIYFDDTMQLSRWITDDVVYCLTRHEDDGAGNIITFKEKHGGHPGEWSQDAWIFTGVNVQKVDADFCLGRRGCDNHLAWLFQQHGMKVLNPSEDIRAIHMHTIDREASMGRGERVGGGNYSKVEIGKLKMI